MLPTQRPPRWQWAALVVVGLLGALMLLNLCRTGYTLWRERHDLADLQYQQDRLARERAQLQAEVEFLQSAEGTEAALRKMGHVKPGERPLRFVEPPRDPAIAAQPLPWPLVVQDTTRLILRQRFAGAD